MSDNGLNDTQPLYGDARRVLHNVSDALTSAQEAYFLLEDAVKELETINQRMAKLHDYLDEQNRSETAQP